MVAAGFDLQTIEDRRRVCKHQVRRHLAGIGHPIVGDTRHNKGRVVRVPAYPDRLWLHAARLEVPFGEGRVIEAPLPPELEATLTALREGRT